MRAPCSRSAGSRSRSRSKAAARPGRGRPAEAHRRQLGASRRHRARNGRSPPRSASASATGSPWTAGRSRWPASAVTAAETPYPNLCFTGGCNTAIPGDQQLEGHGAGLGWVTQAGRPRPGRRRRAESAAYVLNLKLSDPASAPAFISAYDRGHPQGGPVNLLSWQSIATGDALLVTDEQQVLTPGAWLLGLLAMASVAVLVGGRMSEQHPAGRPAEGRRRHSRPCRRRPAGREPHPGARCGRGRAGDREAGRAADHQSRCRARRHARCPLADPVHGRPGHRPCR